MKFTLEQNKFFPYIAWALCIGFALFVFSLALELQAISSHLAGKSNRLERVVEDNSVRLDQLERALEDTD